VYAAPLPCPTPPNARTASVWIPLNSRIVYDLYVLESIQRCPQAPLRIHMHMYPMKSTYASVLWRHLAPPPKKKEYAYSVSTPPERDCVTKLKYGCVFANVIRRQPS